MTWVPDREPGRAYVRQIRRAYAKAGLAIDAITEVTTTTPGDLFFQAQVYLARHMGPDCVVHATQAAIASDLGTAREVVSRALRSLTARGLVKTGRLRVVVLQTEALRAL